MSEDKLSSAFTPISILVIILFTTLVISSIGVAAQSDASPTSSVYAPSSNTEILVGESVTFKVQATDSDDDLHGAAWYLDGTHNGNTYSIGGGYGIGEKTFKFDTPGTYTVESNVFDLNSNYNEDAAKWTVTVTDPNSAPEVEGWRTPDSDKTITEGETVQFGTDVSDQDGNLNGAAWYVDGGDPEYTDWSPSGEYDTSEWERTFDKPGTYTVEAEAFDKESTYSDPISWQITVEEANSAPSASINSPTGDTTVTVGEQIEFAVDATDPDGNLDGAALYINSNDPTDRDWSLSSGSDTASWTRSFDESGRYTVEAEVFDTERKYSNSVSWDVTVEEEPNSAPTATRGSSDQAISVVTGESAELAVTATDPDGNLDGIEWYVDGTFTDETSSISGESGTGSLKKSFAEPGTYTIKAEAFDSDRSYSDPVSWDITVEEGNSAPSASIDRPDRTATVTVGEQIEFVVDATDPDGNLDGAALYVNSNNPTDREFSLSSGSDTASWTRSFDEPGTYTVEAEVFDTERKYSNSVLWDVTVEEEPNSAPTATASKPAQYTRVVAGEDIELAVAATDPDGNLDGIEWYVDGTFTDETSSISGDSGTGSLKKSFAEPGTYPISAKVFDSDRAYSDPISWQIIVEEANSAPSASINSPTGDTTVTVGEQIEFAVDATDPDGNLDGAALYVDSNDPTDREFSLSSGSDTASWTHSFDEPGRYTVEAEVFDTKRKYSDPVSWDITVKEGSNLAPTATRGSSDQAISVVTGESAELAVAATDPDGNLDGIEWYVDGTFTDETSSISGESGTGSLKKSFAEPGTYTIKAEAFDSDRSYSDPVSWTIEVNKRPPKASELDVNVKSVNGQSKQEYGYRVDGSFESITMKITDSDGNPISQNSMQLKFEDNDWKSIEHQNGGVYKFVPERPFSSPTKYVDLSVRRQESDTTSKTSVPISSSWSEISTPIEGWYPSGATTVSVDGKRYAAVKMHLDRDSTDSESNKNEKIESAWLAFNEDGKIVSDSSLRRKVALTAHVDDVTRKATREDVQFLRQKYPSQMDKILRYSEYQEAAFVVRDTGAETLGTIGGAVATGGSNVAAQATVKGAMKTTGKKFAKDVLKNYVKKQVPTNVEKNPASTFKKGIKWKARAELKSVQGQSKTAGNVLADHINGETWDYEAANKYWTAYNESVTDGPLYMSLRTNMLPSAKPTDQLEAITKSAATGATGVPVDEFTSALAQDQLGYISKSFEESARYRVLQSREAKSFGKVGQRIQQRAIKQFDDKAVYTANDAVGKSAEISVVSPPSGDYLPGEKVNAEVKVTNTGATDGTFYVGYSVKTTENGDQRYYDNGGTTGHFVHLASGETTQTTVTWKAEADVPKNRQYGFVAAVWPKLIPEPGDTQLDRVSRNNAFTISRGADLSVQSIEINPKTVEQGKSTTVVAKLSNNGDIHASRIINLSVGGTVRNQNVVSIASDQTTVSTFDIQLNTPGDKTIKVGSKSKRINVAGSGLPPEASLTVGSTNNRGENTVSLSAANSVDEDGEITRYQWDFNGDGLVDKTTQSPTITHSFDQPGEYTIGVTVVDQTGLSDTNTITTTVQPSSTAQKQAIYIWGYADELATDSKVRQRFLDRASEHNWNTAYLSWGALSEVDNEERADLVRTLHQNDIESHVLIGSAGTNAIDVVDKTIPEITSFNENRPRSEQFDGVHLDAEPGQADINVFITEYQTFLSDIEAQSSGDSGNSKELEMSAAIGWWWDQSDKAPQATDELVESEALDYITVMAYYDTVDEVRRRTKMITDETDTPYTVAIESQEFPVDGTSKHVTFYEEGSEAAKGALNQIAANPPRSGYQGSAIHYYQSGVAAWNSLVGGSVKETVSHGETTSVTVSSVFDDEFPRSNHRSKLIVTFQGPEQTYRESKTITHKSGEVTTTEALWSPPKSATTGKYTVTAKIKDLTYVNEDRESIATRDDPVTLDSTTIGEILVTPDNQINNRILQQDSVEITGSEVTIETGGTTAVSVTDLPDDVEITEISDSGFNSTGNIMYQNSSGLPQTVMFRLNPNTTAYTEGSDKVNFTVNGSPVSLDVVRESTVQINSVTLTPNLIPANGSTHTLTFHVTNLSPDDNPDKFAIKVPQSLDVEDASIKDAGGLDPNMLSKRNEVKFNVDPVETTSAEIKIELKLSGSGY